MPRGQTDRQAAIRSGLEQRARQQRFAGFEKRAIGIDQSDRRDDPLDRCGRKDRRPRSDSEPPGADRDADDDRSGRGERPCETRGDALTSIRANHAPPLGVHGRTHTHGALGRDRSASSADANQPFDHHFFGARPVAVEILVARDVDHGSAHLPGPRAPISAMLPYIAVKPSRNDRRARVSSDSAALRPTPSLSEISATDRPSRYFHSSALP